MSDKLEILAQPACCHLRSKAMYVNAGLPPSDELGDEGNFWCLLTQEPFGPDREEVNRQRCIPGRGCHRQIV